MDKQMVDFKGYIIKKFTLEKVEDIPKEKKGNLDLSLDILKNKKDKDKYCLSMGLCMYTDDSRIDLIIDGFFDISSKLDENSKQYFLNISAPAVIYPYARTFISNVTAFDAGETVVLPLVNFSEINLGK